MRVQVASLGALTLMLMGCATSWYNPHYTSRDAHERQETMDTAQCTLYARGAAPMPEVRTYPSPNQSYSFSGTVNSYGPGGYTRSDVTGRVYQAPDPVSSFSTGFGNGVAIGQAIAARKAQDMAFKLCMYQLGWADKKPAGFVLSDEPVATPVQSPAEPSKAKPFQVLIAPYALPEEQEYEAQAYEFYVIHNQYIKDREARNQLKAELDSVMDRHGAAGLGEQLLMAHAEVGLPPPTEDDAAAQQAYQASMGGNPAAQFVLASFHLKGLSGEVNDERAFYWATRSARAGRPDAIALLAMLYADGRGVQADVDMAYRLTMRAKMEGSEMWEAAAARLDRRMTPEQRAALQQKYGTL